MNDGIISVESILDDEIEVLEEDFEPININNNIETLPIAQEKTNKVNNDIILVDRLFTTEKDEKLQAEAKEEIKKDDKKVERVQLFLIVFLVVSATIIYFFGYDFFEPYIKID